MSEPLIPMLFVESYPQERAGQQETLKGLLARCAASGIAPAVASPAEGAFLDELRDAGHDVTVLPQPGLLNRYGGAVFRDRRRARARTLAEAARYVLRLRRFIKAGAWRVIYCNDLRGLLTFGLAARLAGRPVLIWDKLDQPHGWLDQVQLPVATRNLVISRSVRRKYPRWQRSLFGRRIRTVHDGVAVARFLADLPRTVREEIGLPADAVLAMIVGTVSARKGHDVLLDALDLAQREVPGLHLAIAGEAPADQVEFRDRLRARAVPQVHWLGYRRDIPEILAASDLLVLPSRHEGMGRVCAEAMLMGRPVIGTRETGIADIVGDGNTGYLVTPGSVSELAQRLVTLARDADLRRRMGDAGSRFARVELDADHQHARVLAALRELAGC